MERDSAETAETPRTWQDGCTPEDTMPGASGLLRLGDNLAPRWIAPLFLAFSVILIPWIAVLSVTLPDRQLARHYNLSWAGFDVLLVLAMGRTAWLAFREKRQMELAAVATATLLIVDAWFDVTTAQPGWPLAQAILLAVFVELPTAALAFYISRRVERLSSGKKQAA